MDAIATTHCNYKRLENGIHAFELTDATRAAVDDFFNLRRKLQDEVTEEQMLILAHLNMRQLPSLTHIMTHVKSLAQDYPRIQPTCTAILYRQGMLVFVLNSFLKVFLRSKDRVMFFAEDQADKAQDWLLSLPPPAQPR
jgi:hypothetical protein